MEKIMQDMYRGWNVTIKSEQNMCSNFGFDITDPAGHTQSVPMGGDSEQRAMERAREMIDMECDFASDN